MKTTQVWMATLKEDKVGEYETLHDHIPSAIVRQLTDSGVTDLRIYRDGLTLIMTVEEDTDRIVPDRIADEAAEKEWDDVTDNCFAVGWNKVTKIFELPVKK